MVKRSNVNGISEIDELKVTVEFAVVTAVSMIDLVPKSHGADRLS